MTIPEYSVQRPVTVLILTILLTGIAAILIPRLAVNLYPEVSPPVISVVTSFPGAGPEDVEQNVTVPLEAALSTVTGLDSLTSSSGMGSSRITLRFRYGEDLDRAMQEVTGIIGTTTNRLPQDAGTPVARRFNLANLPIMQLVIRGPYPLEELRAQGLDRIAPAIERIPGVAAAEITGGGTRGVQVYLSQNRLAAHGLSTTAVINALNNQNVLTTAGRVSRDTTEFQVRVNEEITSVEQLRRVIIRNAGGDTHRVVRLEDLGRVELVSGAEEMRVFVNGQPGVFVRVQNTSDSNAVQVADTIVATLADINTNLPDQMEVSVLTDNTALIRATLDQVYTAALQGALLAMAILFFFLRNVKSTIIIGLSLPVSVAITLMAMSVVGLTLNLITLTGLIMGLGMVVDGSIVILENIHTYRERGAKASIAAILGSQEMYRAIVASTFTTLAVFIPIMIFRNQLDFMGQFFGDLVFTVVISLLVSLGVAITLVPALAGALMPLQTRVQKPLRIPFLRSIDDGMERGFRRLEQGYRRTLGYAITHRLAVLTLTGLVLIFSLMQFEGTSINLFVRSLTDDTVFFSIRMPEGTPVEETEAVLLELAAVAERETQGWNSIVVTAGANRWGNPAGSHQGALQINLPSPADQIDNPTTIRQTLMPYLNQVAGADISFAAGRRASTGTAVRIDVTSEHADLAADTAREIRAALTREVPQVQDPEVSLERGGPELAIRIDRERAAALGVSAPTLAREIRTAYAGSRATTIKHEGVLMDVVVQLQEDDRRDPASLDHVLVSGNGGALIPLSNVASIVEGQSATSIAREDRRRIVSVTGDLPPGIGATEIQPLLQRAVADHVDVPPTVTVSLGGEAQEIDRFGNTFILIIAVAVVLVFGIMASQFESLLDPLIIFFSIPLLFIGVIWIYHFSEEPFSLFAAVGVVALVGIVVNNGIVLVDYTNTLRARGMNLSAAVLSAGQSRLRPILMTSLTTILGMVPLAFFPGEGAETIQPIGKTIVGGLAVSSLMTLYVTPVMYSLLNGIGEWFRNRTKEPTRTYGDAPPVVADDEWRDAL